MPNQVVAKREPERPAIISSLMEAVCERDNLKTDLGLIDEYEFVVQPRLAGQGPDIVRGAIEAHRLESS
jgi:hypothetical protein